jgi:hypothetical protein
MASLTSMQRVLEQTSIFVHLSPSQIGSTHTTSDGNFPSTSGSTGGLQLSIPLASRKEERDHALRPWDGQDRRFVDRLDAGRVIVQRHHDPAGGAHRLEKT